MSATRHPLIGWLHALLTPAIVLAPLAWGGAASAAEICRFAGTTDYSGHVAITTDVAATGEDRVVDVTLRFEATRMVWLHIRYLIEEVSVWRGGEMRGLSVNSRYFVGDHIVRQQWDDFQRDPAGLLARRVQAKTEDDFRRAHPGFIRHWDPASFGLPWLPDYPTAPPQRRPDLDLTGPETRARLRSPLAMAFYWVRFLPHDGAEETVFLPGFKTDKLVRLPISGAASPAGTTWRVPLRYIALSDAPASTATALTSPDGHLLRLGFELHGSAGSARGRIEQAGCEGTVAPP